MVDINDSLFGIRIVPTYIRISYNLLTVLKYCSRKYSSWLKKMSEIMHDDGRAHV